MSSQTRVGTYNLQSSVVILVVREQGDPLRLQRTKVEVSGMLQVYNELQIKQLTRLIEVTRTELPKADRQKVMNMITIDAHSRDIVENIITSGTSR